MTARKGGVLVAERVRVSMAIGGVLTYILDIGRCITWPGGCHR